MTTAIIGAGNIGRTIAGQLAVGGRGVRGTRVAGLPHHNSGGFPARAPTPRGPDRRWIGGLVTRFGSTDRARRRVVRELGLA